MATYITLVNQLLVRLNEVTLDTAGDGFTTVRNVQALAKDAINNSIRNIIQDRTRVSVFKNNKYTNINSRN